MEVSPDKTRDTFSIGMRKPGADCSLHSINSVYPRLQGFVLKHEKAALNSPLPSLNETNNVSDYYIEPMASIAFSQFWHFLASELLSTLRKLGPTDPTETLTRNGQSQNQIGRLRNRSRSI
jgi:hypothetical protein